MASINLSSNLVKTVMLKVIGDGGDAKKTLDEIAAQAEALKELNPELTVSINRAKAMADAVVMKAQMARVLNDDPLKIKVVPDDSAFTKFFFNSLYRPATGGTPFTGAGAAELNRMLAGNPFDYLYRSSGGTFTTEDQRALGRLLMEPDVKRSLMQRLTGGAGGGNFIKSLATPGGWGSFFGNTPAEVSSVSGGAGGIAKFLISPAGIAAAGAAVVAASPLIVSLLGGLVGGAGAAGALKIASNANASLTALQATQTSAQQALAQAQQQQRFYPSAANAAAVATAGANLTQANQAVTGFQKANAPALGLYGAMQNVGSAASAAFMSALSGGGRSSFISGLEKIINQLPGFITKVGPELGAMFRASLPYLDAWVKIFEGFASRAMPAITSALQHFARFMPDIVHLFNGVSDAIAAIIRAFGWMAESVGIDFQAILRFIRDVKHWYDDLNKWTGDLIKSFLGWFGRIAPALYQIGKDAIQGLIRGLENIPVIGAAVSIGAKLIGGIKGVLGIRSPSTVAMGLGRNFTEGFYIGLGQAGQGAGVGIRGAGGGGAGGGLMIAPGAGGVLEQAIVQIIRQYVVSRGGGGKNSVQVAFGQHS